MNNLKTLIAGAGFALLANAGLAQTWVVDPSASAVSFGSVKKGSIGEAHSFTAVSGQVGQDGRATITVALGSVETNIDIRNERMIEHVFNNMEIASVTGEVDMDAVQALAIGEMAPVYVDATLHMMGESVGFDAPMIAVRLGENRAMIVSDGIAYLSTADLGIDEGIDKLMELASLPSIARSFPLTVRLVFDLQE